MQCSFEPTSLPCAHVLCKTCAVRCHPNHGPTCLAQPCLAHLYSPPPRAPHVPYRDIYCCRTLDHALHASAACPICRHDLTRWSLMLNTRAMKVLRAIMHFLLAFRSRGSPSTKGFGGTGSAPRAVRAGTTLHSGQYLHRRLPCVRGVAVGACDRTTHCALRAHSSMWIRSGRSTPCVGYARP